jgi:hypothetical protein
LISVKESAAPGVRKSKRLEWFKFIKWKNHFDQENAFPTGFWTAAEQFQGGRTFVSLQAGNGCRDAGAGRFARKFDSDQTHTPYIRLGCAAK